MNQPYADARVHVTRSLHRLRETTDLPVALGGLVTSDRRTFKITELSGTLTRSLAGLEIANGHGLGGRALQLRRPAIVADYMAARGITHRYDHHVTPEQLRFLVCVPIATPGKPPVAMMYVGSRAATPLGDRTLDLVRPIADDLARDLTIELEIERRLRRRAETAQRRGHAELRELRTALGIIMSETGDARTRMSLARLLGLHGAAGLAPPAPRTGLTQREREVLTLAGEGLTNADIAVELCLATQTVKAYVKSAMAKLDARNRVQAARAAQVAGLLESR